MMSMDLNHLDHFRVQLGSELGSGSGFVSTVNHSTLDASCVRTTATVAACRSYTTVLHARSTTVRVLLNRLCSSWLGLHVRVRGRDLPFESPRAAGAVYVSIPLLRLYVGFWSNFADLFTI